MTRKRDRIIIRDKFLGEIVTSIILYNECESCHEKSFPPLALKKIFDSRLRKQNDLINSLPVSEFYSATIASKKLGISRQALHKKININKAPIYYTEIDRKKFYNKKSINKYLVDGDGRYKLEENDYSGIKFISLGNELNESTFQVWCKNIDNLENITSWEVDMNQTKGTIGSEEGLETLMQDLSIDQKFYA
ncbi:MAG: hypothetical protein HQ509_02970 [Candidatus Marinimicrobia bacterium]|nr:hypothetical protein [Candidatus Neomarinimicrobiota bacterium]